MDGRGPESESAQAALRRALLQRIADRLAYARAFDSGALIPDNRCCWVSYEWPTAPPYTYPMHQMDLRLCKDTCPHWHHEFEVQLAARAHHPGLPVGLEAVHRAPLLYPTADEAIAAASTIIESIDGYVIYTDTVDDEQAAP